jgi:hypothetical protein
MRVRNTLSAVRVYIFGESTNKFERPEKEVVIRNGAGSDRTMRLI